MPLKPTIGQRKNISAKCPTKILCAEFQKAAVTTNRETVAILGASPNPERFAHKALCKLQEHGHKVIPVNPAHEQIDGVPVVKTLGEIAEPVDTLTIYLGPDRLRERMQDILHLRPNRVIFNPGTELPELMKELDKAHIPHVEACTLVLLATGKF